MDGPQLLYHPYQTKKTIALEVENCYHIEDSKTRALVVKGLSRLPVTEEIAGSNPVGPAIILMFKASLLGESFLIS